MSTVLALAAAGPAEAMLQLEPSCRASACIESAPLLHVQCSSAADAAYGCALRRSASRAGQGDTLSMLVIPMPSTSRRAGTAEESLRALVARVATGAAFASVAQAGTPTDCCGLQPVGRASGVAAAIAATTLHALYAPLPPAEPPPRASLRVRCSARS